MSNIWLRQELYSRDEKEVIKKNQGTEGVAEQVDGFSPNSGEREAQGLVSWGSSKNI